MFVHSYLVVDTSQPLPNSPRSSSLLYIIHLRQSLHLRSFSDGILGRSSATLLSFLPSSRAFKLVSVPTARPVCFAPSSVGDVRCRRLESAASTEHDGTAAAAAAAAASAGGERGQGEGEGRRREEQEGHQAEVCFPNEESQRHTRRRLSLAEVRPESGQEQRPSQVS